MGKADELSRRPDWHEGVERDNKDQKLIKPEWVRGADTELVTRNYWWPGVVKEVERYMDGCDACQRYKNQSKVPAGKLMPNTIPEKPWSHITADFITKLPLAQGYDAILVVYDRFSKMVHFIATTEKTLAEELAKLFQDHI